MSFSLNARGIAERKEIYKTNRVLASRYNGSFLKQRRNENKEQKSDQSSLLSQYWRKTTGYCINNAGRNLSFNDGKKKTNKCLE